MFDRIRRRAAEPSEMQRQFFAQVARLPAQIPTEVERMRAEPTAVVDDFLPPELRVPTNDQLGGRMTSWQQPLVFDGELVACAECGVYRGWVILSTRDQIWLRCPAGHQQLETRLDTAWYNRHTGPADSTHATFEDCLRHLGH
ncbi:hypothetical protein [Streptomyces sp. H39-C1]|uniref:hypothetical protein n=1 Tax=Streptomyces sp. H39-C1 TaxID=3004355 RepID=UPI0022B05328|nr:hypothetical protein [Streptomyces sp. H39-C1]MCZ4103415.1 hypothetical protein [Streptomyces sp. H39-C1]